MREIKQLRDKSENELKSLREKSDNSSKDALAACWCKRWLLLA